MSPPTTSTADTLGAMADTTVAEVSALKRRRERAKEDVRRTAIAADAAEARRAAAFEKMRAAIVYGQQSEHLSYEELAELCGRSTGQVAKILARARNGT